MQQLFEMYLLNRSNRVEGIHPLDRVSSKSPVSSYLRYPASAIKE